MSRASEAWGAWVDLWVEREDPDTYALLRITWSLLVIAWLVDQILEPGVVGLYATAEHGGTWGPMSHELPNLFALFEPTQRAVVGLIAVDLFAAFCMLVGLQTRLASAVVAWINLSLVGRLGLYNYGGDAVVRVFGILMVLAPLGASWSLDARARGSVVSVPRWPRRLLIAQLTLLYVKTGLVKFGSHWTVPGGLPAVYYALNQPMFSRFDPSWTVPLFPLTQVGTFVSRWWEMLFWLLPVNLYLRRDPERGGVLRRALARWDLRPVFLGIGVVMHLTLFATMLLGLFTWIMLALYPMFLAPREARSLLERVLPADWRGDTGR